MCVSVFSWPSASHQCIVWLLYVALCNYLAILGNIGQYYVILSNTQTSHFVGVDSLAMFGKEFYEVTDSDKGLH